MTKLFTTEFWIDGQRFVIADLYFVPEIQYLDLYENGQPSP